MKPQRVIESERELGRSLQMEGWTHGHIQTDEFNTIGLRITLTDIRRRASRGRNVSSLIV